MRTIWRGTLLLAVAVWSALPFRAGAASPVGMALVRSLAEEGDWASFDVEWRRLELSSDAGDAAALARLRAETSCARRTAHARPSPWVRAGALPVRLMVGFYRLMVAPALGARCVLSPSCSAYSMQAARERGWLGIPMTGDRLVREPSVVMAKEHPEEDESGRVRYADPVSDHIGGKSSVRRW